jgi:hypothetical protein
MLPLVLVLSALAWSPIGDAQALRPEHRIVDQPDAPVHVTAYRTELLKRTAESQEGLRHDIEYRSRTDQRIVAIQFGLVGFDVWNEFLDKNAALASGSLDARGRERSSWFTPTAAGVAFFTGVVYVERVRFANGEIWTADQDAVLTAMRAVQKDFDAQHLQRKAK